MMQFSYKNQHSRMVIEPCIGEKSFFVEKVVLSFEIIAFEAPKDSRVEIWGNDLTGLHLEDSMYVGQTEY